MFTTRLDMIAMNIGYLVEFVGAVVVMAFAIMVVGDIVVARWNRRVRMRP